MKYVVVLCDGMADYPVPKLYDFLLKKILILKATSVNSARLPLHWQQLLEQETSSVWRLPLHSEVPVPYSGAG